MAIYTLHLDSKGSEDGVQHEVQKPSNPKYM
jgi:hypothetical protein